MSDGHDRQLLTEIPRGNSEESGNRIDSKFYGRDSCRKCGIILTNENKFPSDIKKGNRICKKCKINCSSNWAKNHRIRINELQSKWRKKFRTEVLFHYSPSLKCTKCGFSDIRALTIDHITGGGAKQREQLNTSSYGLYCWLKKNNYPKGYQVLCFNCQWIKRCENKEWGKHPRKKK